MRRSALAVVVAMIVAVLPAQALAGDNPFPIGKQSVPEKYRGLQQLPVGISFGYTYLNDLMDISDFSFSLGGQPLPPGAIEVSGARHKTAVKLARFDTWILPFLDVYGLAAVLDGQAEDVAFKVNPIPGLPALPIPSTIAPSYTGHFYGVGATLAGGYKAFFASYDINRQ